MKKLVYDLDWISLKFHSYLKVKDKEILCDCVMNSWAEFHQAPLVRVVTVVGLLEEQGEEEQGRGQQRGARGGRCRVRQARGRGRGRNRINVISVNFKTSNLPWQDNLVLPTGWTIAYDGILILIIENRFSWLTTNTNVNVYKVYWHI